MKKVIFLSCFCVFFLINTCTAADVEYQHSASVDTIVFDWSVDGESLHIRLKAKTTGWVGIGFNPTEGMKDANFLIGYVKKGKVEIRDDYGSGERRHSEDTKDGGQDNVSNASGKEENGITEISFTIPLNSGDAKDSILTPDGDTMVLLAYGAGRDSFLSKHQYHGVLKVNLSTGKHEQVNHHQ